MQRPANKAPASGPTVPKAPARRTLRRYTEAQVDELVERYERGDSAETIEAELGIPASTVYYHLKRRAIARRPCAVPYKHPVPEERVCARDGCDNKFSPTGYSMARGWGRFCSRACHYAARQVAEPEERVCVRKGCEVRFTPYPSEAVRPGHGQFCSHRCRQLHFWRADHGAHVMGFVESLTERGLYKGRALQRWGGIWNATKPPAPGGRPRGRPSLELTDEQRRRIKLARRHWGRRRTANEFGLSEWAVRLVELDDEA